MVVDGDILNGVLEVDVGGNVNAGVAIEAIVVYGTADDAPAILTPDMKAIMVIGVWSAVPVRVVVDVIVVDAEPRNSSGGTEREPVVNVVDHRVGQSEIVPPTRKGPACIMASDMGDREIVGLEPIDAIEIGLRGRHIRVRGPHVYVDDGQMLDRAIGAVEHVDGAAVLVIGKPGAVSGISNHAVGAAIDRNIGEVVGGNRTLR